MMESFMKRYAFGLFIGMLAIAALACGPLPGGDALPGDDSGGEDGAPVAEADSGGDFTEEDLAPETGGGAGGSIDLSPNLTFAGPSDPGVDSFSTRYVFNFTPEGESEPSLTTLVVVESQSEPSAIRVTNTFDSSGFAVEEAPAMQGVLITLIVNDLLYQVIQQEGVQPICTSSAAAADIYEQTFNQNNFTNQVSPFDETVSGEFEYIGAEEVNGIATDHFAATGLTNYGTYNTADVEIWQQTEDQRVVRMHIVGQIADPEQGSGTQEITYELLSLNEPLDFTPPEACG